MKTIRIGRNTDQDFPLDDSSVSRKHAELYVESGNLFIRDLKSSNGTFVVRNGVRIVVTDHVELVENDALYFGDSGPHSVEALLDTAGEGTQVGRKQALPRLGLHRSVTMKTGAAKVRCLSCGVIVSSQQPKCPECGGRFR